MKYSFTIVLIFCSAFFVLNACNNSGERSEAKSDTTFTTVTTDTISAKLNKRSSDSLQAIKHLNDSMNLAIDILNTGIKALQDSANKSNNLTTKDNFLKQKGKLNQVCDAARDARNHLTSEALKGLTEKLNPIIATLKIQVSKLQQLAENIQTAVDIFALIDKALASAAAAGFVKIPVVLPAT